MSYHLIPRNKDQNVFTFGAFSFPILLDACGYLWPCIQHGPRYYCVFGIDERMPESDRDYEPALLTSSGFRVTAEEARIMARMARNFVGIQRSLPEENRGDGNDFMKPDWERVWPLKIRDDFVDKFEKFSEWAVKSGGFQIK